MRWEDENWIKVYTRDTATWLSLDWRSRGICLELARKVDRAGVLKVGRLGLKGVAILVGASEAEAMPYIRELLDVGKILWREDLGEVLLVDHQDMQEAVTSDAERKRRSRVAARSRISEPAPPVTPGHAESREVTQCHDIVTERDTLASPDGSVDPQPIDSTPSESRSVTHGHAESREVTFSHDQIRSDQIRSEKQESPVPGSMGFSEQCWREGVQAATGRKTAPLPAFLRSDVENLFRYFSEGESMDARFEWLRRFAREYAQHEQHEHNAKFGITPRRAIAWLESGRPRGRPDEGAKADRERAATRHQERVFEKRHRDYAAEAVPPPPDLLSALLPTGTSGGET